MTESMHLGVWWHRSCTRPSCSSGQFRGQIRGQKSGAGDGLGMRLVASALQMTQLSLRSPVQVHDSWIIPCCNPSHSIFEWWLQNSFSCSRCATCYYWLWHPCNLCTVPSNALSRICDPAVRENTQGLFQPFPVQARFYPISSWWKRRSWKKLMTSRITSYFDEMKIRQGKCSVQQKQWRRYWLCEHGRSKWSSLGTTTGLYKYDVLWWPNIFWYSWSEGSSPTFSLIVPTLHHWHRLRSPFSQSFKVIAMNVWTESSSECTSHQLTTPQKGQKSKFIQVIRPQMKLLSQLITPQRKLNTNLQDQESIQQWWKMGLLHVRCAAPPQNHVKSLDMEWVSVLLC